MNTLSQFISMLKKIVLEITVLVHNLNIKENILFFNYIIKKIEKSKIIQRKHF